jgi:hypothetical protein
MRRTAGHIWTDYKTTTEFAKELNIIPVFDMIQSYKRKWIQHTNRVPRDRLRMLIKICTPKGRRNQGRPLKRLWGE